MADEGDFPVLILTEAGPTAASYNQVMGADYSGEGIPANWTADKEMALVRYADLLHRGHIKLPPEWVDRPIRDTFDDYLGDNPEFNMEPLEPTPVDSPPEEEPATPSGAERMEGLNANPLSGEAREQGREAQLEGEDLGEFFSKMKADPQERIDYLSPRSDPDAKGIGDIMKQVRDGAAKKAIEDDRNKAMTATLGALAPEKASEVPKVLHMQESKRDVREDEEKK